MRLFHCDRCGAIVPFAAVVCGTCAAELGYVTDERTIRQVTPTADPASYLVGGDTRPFWRCLNSAWGCNWMVPADEHNVWCRSCRLTRGRPDVARPDAVGAWMVAEAAKRRLVHQLDELSLPVEGRSEATPDGLAFDFVHLPGEGGITGHLDGVVTLDLAEVDDGHRDELRRRLGEPFRTVIGHLRHEVGHHYWKCLVRDTDDLEAARALFGDDRIDYAEAVQRYYSGASPDWDDTQFVSAYAASHPFEDWAETFGHYLHILDALGTAASHGLVAPIHEAAATDPRQHELAEILAAWQPISEGVNAVADAVGSPPVYPFEPTGIVVEKLTFVHRHVAGIAPTGRDAARSVSEAAHPE